jgi:HEPN superfamily AbiU2-like protein
LGIIAVVNADQKANIDAAVRELCESLFSAWSYFHLLRGLNEGARSNPEVIERFSWIFEQMWRAIFDGFFARVGTLLDATRSTYSLPNLVTLIRRYGDADLKQLLPEAEACLAEKDSAISKIRQWRHEAVAHRSTARDQDFYVTNKMSLPDLEAALKQLEDAVNHLSWHVLSIHNDTRGGSEGLIEEGKRLFASLSKGLNSQRTEDPNAEDK